MKRLFAVGAVLGAFFVVGPASASATIHPIMLGWYCGKASGDPPGQTPGENHSDQSTFRALQATGFVAGFNPDGSPILDTSIPASKFSTFDPETETGTPSSPGALNCANAPAP